MKLLASIYLFFVLMRLAVTLTFHTEIARFVYLCASIKDENVKSFRSINTNIASVPLQSTTKIFSIGFSFFFFLLFRNFMCKLNQMTIFYLFLLKISQMFRERPLKKNKKRWIGRFGSGNRAQSLHGSIKLVFTWMSMPFRRQEIVFPQILTVSIIASCSSFGRNVYFGWTLSMDGCHISTYI